MSDLLTLAEAANKLACSKATVIRLVKAGKLTTVQLGLSLKGDRVHPDDLEAFIRNARREKKGCRSASAETRGKSLSVGMGRSIVDLVAIGRGIRPEK